MTALPDPAFDPALDLLEDPMGNLRHPLTGPATALPRTRAGPAAPGRRATLGGTAVGTAAGIACALLLPACDSNSSDAPRAAAGSPTPAQSSAAASTDPTAASAATGGPPAGTSSAAPSTAATAPDGLVRCSSGALQLTLRDPGAGAGQRFLTVVLTNEGTRCRIEGYGGIGLVDAAGKPVPTMQVRDPAVPPRPVVLDAGAAAVSRLQWSVVPGGPEETSGPCKPVPATLQVIPPDETVPLQAAWSFGPVCSGGRIEQQAYRAAAG